MCVAGARWVQREVLEKHPAADLKVYAISFFVLPSDVLARWAVSPEDWMPDRRVAHFWDGERRVGRWYSRHVTGGGEGDADAFEWDAYFLYAPDVSWEDDPPAAIRWGSTIMEKRQELRASLEEMLRAASQKTLPEAEAR